MNERKGRTRFLSDEEIDLWLSVARSVVARRGALLPDARSKPSPPAPKDAPPRAEDGRGTAPVQPAAVAPRKASPPPLAPFEKRYRQKVTRGRVAIEAAIDLHGMNQAEAHQALQGFLFSEHRQGSRLVLVVTGKGRARQGPASSWRDGEAGVLRRAVPDWLRAEALRPIVLGFEEAGLPHGGLGALYVRLRRRGG